MKATPVAVEMQDGLPYRVKGSRVSHLIDSYRLWPNWWEGYAPRDYWLFEVEAKTLEVYSCGGQWFLARTLD